MDGALENALNRLINYTDSAEGSLLPPLQVGGSRIPTVTNLQIVKTDRVVGGDVHTLTWLDVQDGRNLVDHYNIFAVKSVNNNWQPTLAASVHGSPAVITEQHDLSNQFCTFIVQTVLINGMSSAIELSPSVSTKTLSTLVTQDQVVPGLLTSNYWIQNPATAASPISMFITSAAGTNILNYSGGAGALLGVGIRVNTAPTLPDDGGQITLQFNIDSQGTTNYIVYPASNWQGGVYPVSQTIGSVIPAAGRIATAAYGTVSSDIIYFPVGISFSTSCLVVLSVAAGATAHAGDLVPAVSWAKKIS